MTDDDEPEEISVDLDYSEGLPVKRVQCKTCIYRPHLGWDLQRLEDQVRDPHIGFRGSRICHTGNDAICAGFWARHKDEFAAGQVAQRLGLVVWKN